jgi:hypothetical protein
MRIWPLPVHLYGPRPHARLRASHRRRLEAVEHRQDCIEAAPVPPLNRSTKSSERKREQKKRWFRNGQKWRTGCEGRISVIKRRHGLSRCRYKGDAGMKRWVGLGVIADNVINHYQSP